MALRWFNSLVSMTLLFSLRWHQRWLFYGLVGAAVVWAAFLLVFNIPRDPLERLHQLTAVGRFGHILDTKSNNTLVRKYI